MTPPSRIQPPRQATANSPYDSKKWKYDLSFLEAMSDVVEDSLINDGSHATSSQFFSFHTAPELQVASRLSNWLLKTISPIVTTLVIFLINLCIHQLPLTVSFALGVPLIHFCLQVHEFIRTGAYVDDQTEAFPPNIAAQHSNFESAASFATAHSSHRSSTTYSTTTVDIDNEHFDDNHRSSIRPHLYLKLLLTNVWYVACRFLYVINPWLALLSTFVLVVHWTGMSNNFTFALLQFHVEGRGIPRGSLRLDFQSVVEDVRNFYKFWIGWIVGSAKSIVAKTDITKA